LAYQGCFGCVPVTKKNRFTTLTTEGSGRPVSRDEGDSAAVPGQGLPRRQQQRSDLQIPVYMYENA